MIPTDSHSMTVEQIAGLLCEYARRSFEIALGQIIEVLSLPDIRKRRGIEDILTALRLGLRQIKRSQVIGNVFTLRAQKLVGPRITTPLLTPDDQRALVKELIEREKTLSKADKRELEEAFEEIITELETTDNQADEICEYDDYHRLINIVLNVARRRSIPVEEVFSNQEAHDEVVRHLISREEMMEMIRFKLSQISSVPVIRESIGTPIAKLLGAKDTHDDAINREISARDEILLLILMPKIAAIMDREIARIYS